MAKISKYLNFWKPLIDRSIAILLLIALLPVFLCIILVLLISGNRVFFMHVRPGLDGVPFKLIKFTTMKAGVVFSIGKILRKTSLDELPQLWNVIRGEMSIVGPRPLLMEYMQIYSEQQLRRHEVKPGVTGWAQVNGRNILSLRDKVAYDLYYVDHVSFWLDMKILLRSFGQVIKWSEADHHALKPGSLNDQ
ncbi:MAG: sugar transferase [Marinoscillum sp.]